MSSLTFRVLGLSVAIGTGAGFLARAAPKGEGWLVALLGLCAGGVALAQQTLP